MNNYMNENDAFKFESENDQNNFDFNAITGLGESNYQNEDLFGNENEESKTNASFGAFDSDVMDYLNQSNYIEQPLDQTVNNEVDSINQEEKSFVVEPFIPEEIEENDEVNVDEQQNDFIETESDNLDIKESYKEEIPFVEETPEVNEEIFNTPFESNEENVEAQEIQKEFVENNIEEKSLIDTEFLDDENYFTSNSLENDYELPIEQPTVQTQLPESNNNLVVDFVETPIEELTKLTEYEDEKIETTDIKALFDRVGVNVKEASDIFKKNTEMKSKIDSRFEELKKLQSEVEKSKQSQYDEINAYKEEVLLKLTQKKEEIEKRLNKLKDFQASLEKEKQEFEQYRKTEKEEIERVQKEVQEAYDNRRDELNHLEDVLRKQKDALDDERAQLSLDRIQYESDKNELANNLLKFNEIVDTFTNGMDKLNN